MIHPTAIVAPGARLHESVNVGPYCVIGEQVEIAAGCDLAAHVFIEGTTRIGERNRFFPFTTVGVAPQDLKYRGEPSALEIGAENTFREFVSVHRGTEGGGALTRVGNGCLLQAHAHAAHDCRLGDRVILGHGATLAGHVTIEDFAYVGAWTGIHQFCRIGQHSIIGGYSVITKDVMPFSMTVADRKVRAFGVNRVGLERHGFSQERIERLHHAFRLLLSSKLNTSQALEQIRAEGLNEDLEVLLGFIESSERGVIK
jgi:UDP-N-acetylglucosamine acyltransferase